MVKEYKGHVILGGDTIGEAAVTHQGLNTTASYMRALRSFKQMAICSDQNNPELYGKDLFGKIICLPQTIGSTTGGLLIETIAKQGLAPKALLFSNKIDSLAAAGVILADVWVSTRIITLDQLGAEFLDEVKTGQEVEIREDGTVFLQ